MCRCLLSLLSVWGALSLPACQKAPTTPSLPPPAEVSVSVPIERQIVDYEEYTGRVDAVYYIDVKARVTGYLFKVNFKEGDEVKKNDVLYEIDPRPAKAALDQALGQLQQLRGKKQVADAQVVRYEKLVPKGAASQQELDVYRGQQAENRGAIEAAEANIAAQRLTLEFCTIRAPVDGRISRTNLQIGNIVNQDSTLLTTLVSIDPMYVFFNVEEATLLRIRNLVRQGRLPNQTVENIEVHMGLVDDENREYPLRGHVNMVNNQVDPLTGTIMVRAVFANADRKLVPGLFARVRVLMGTPRHALLANERALGTDQGQKFVYIVDDHNKAIYRRVRTGQVHSGLRAIEEGLKPGERIVVNGLQRVRPGLEVKAETVDMVSLIGKAETGAPPSSPSAGTDHQTTTAVVPPAAPSPAKIERTSDQVTKPKSE